ncbi:MAG: hypothetical protein A3G34_13890 [Candidatus Lindowbacteria bacterium RIFCSPLOWO2_12_FULL_62_27]|nr:MAG: hypothetical protein A3I06_04035 [Candidatus Lindowbacteria bacterium RIFCSPLOWO2_02_FULL_62_12]OGH62664.1 MAG: hypothetical protein A3G34_13890 [Candidatus Lindowbacteria bacterium RIFCSPLOWO2_12_FULL_62_27]
MGDPEYFAVLHGSNPHTRTRWGARKRVDRDLAKRQWAVFADQLRSSGVEVHVLPPSPDCPGLVYPANAGILQGRTFYPANLLPARAPERPHYERFFSGLGYDVTPFAGGRVRFEGEADFFPWGDRMIFTHGPLKRQRTVLTWQFPFYKRVYGFRSDRRALDVLKTITPQREIVDLELCDERYYHGDTCLCSFGPRRERLLAYLPALTRASQEKLRALAADRLVALSDADAACYAANAFAAEIDRPHLFMTGAASEELRRRIGEAGVEMVTVDVSEFLKKGGGSVKCMVFDLAGVPSPQA